MRGEIDFAEALRLRVGLLKGLPLQSLHDTVAHTRLSPGAERLVKTMRAAGARTVLISGGFDVFTHHAARMAGFEKNFGNRLGMAPDSLTGEVLLPIVDKDFKKRQLEEECRQLGISPALAVATGDGANDIPMLQAAGVGVGYYAKPAVVAATPFQIRHTDLSAILYLQGYRRAQFAL
jgi:phosphoserine phosphatase